MRECPKRCKLGEWVKQSLHTGMVVGQGAKEKAGVDPATCVYSRISGGNCRPSTSLL